jgi:hypothetical protein
MAGQGSRLDIRRPARGDQRRAQERLSDPRVPGEVHRAVEGGNVAGV